MAIGGGPKPAAYVLLLVNLILFFIVIVIAAWAMNHGIERSPHSPESASVLSVPLRIFPIYFPMGNMATGFFVIFSLIAGVVGIATSLTGLHNVFQWDVPSLHTAAASSLVSWCLTLLAMGLACKEIELGWTSGNLRTLEIIKIIVSATQLFSTCAIQAGVEEAIAEQTGRTAAGRY